ncbi:MAG: hypothetical protein R2932_48185 [Caldilineaceae bacterium]
MPAFRAMITALRSRNLAQSWRPGDLILVNAGWVYTVLETYWPIAVTALDGAVPPPISQIARLHDYANQVSVENTPPQEPILVRSGSVDGMPALGWGEPQSDFFALSRPATEAALHELAQHYRRIWHYRLYDTVNDPEGAIRAWLETHGTPLLDEPIPGRDFLRLQLYALAGEPDADSAMTASTTTPLALVDHQYLSTAVAAGQMFYLDTTWRRGAAFAIPSVISFSLRLYGEKGLLVAQQDETPLQPVATWPAERSTTHVLALPIPLATQPGFYSLQLLLYDGASGQALDLMGAPGNLIDLGELTVTPAVMTMPMGTTLARFDYIDLIQAAIRADHTADRDNDRRSHFGCPKRIPIVTPMWHAGNCATRLGLPCKRGKTHWAAGNIPVAVGRRQCRFASR